MAILKRLTPNGDFLIPGEFEESQNIGETGSIKFGEMGGATSQTDYNIVSYGGILDVPGGPRASNPLNLGTSDFTFEFWIKINSYYGGEYKTGYPGDIYYSSSTQSYFSNYNDLSSQLSFSGNYYSGNPYGYTFDWRYLDVITYYNWTVTPFPLNTWTHHALVKTNTSFIIYVNGQGYSPSYNSGSIYSSNITIDGNLRIGSTQQLSPRNHPHNFVSGKMTGIHLTKEAKYTSNFTPSTTPPSATANTILLLNAETVTNAFVDSSSLNQTVTTNTSVGNVSWDNDDPYPIISSRATQEVFYAYQFDEVTIHPLTNGLAMRETANSTMIAGEFDEMSLIGSDIINSSITKNSDFAYVDGQLYRVETFTSNAIITFSENTTIDFLLVGGGQAGANGYSAGVYSTNYYKGNSGRPGEVVEQYSYAVTTDQAYLIEVGNYGTLLSSGDPISLAAKPSKIKFYNGTPIATANAGQIFVDNAKTVKFIGGVLSNSAPGTLVTVTWSSEEYMTDYASDSPGTLSYMTGKPVYYSSHYTTNPTRFIRATGRTATTYGGGGEGGVSNPGFYTSSRGGYGGQGVVIIRYRV